MTPIVSVITPTYNSERYVAETIASLQAQTLTDWELLVVDDCSTDNTYDLVQRIASDDSRIRLFRQEANSGAGPARTRALENSLGRYIAYLDADDIWFPDKLQRQVDFMMTRGCGFSCTSYEVIDGNGASLNKVVRMLPETDYVGFLTTNLLQTVGIMVDVQQVDKNLLRMPPLKRRQDAATWLQILKAGHKNYGMDEVLCQYRHAQNSLSSNKFRAAQGVWRLYREVEQLPLGFSLYCFARYAFLAVWKRSYFLGRVFKARTRQLG
ncbi:glycosyltransferase family 2 protein [Mycolicibacterium obuense]|uniref:Glycosyltransferase family 2 protein n=1 Tax=Mycolicibacterium obuense TaxID=1807 RepID=A0A4R5X8L0_9MYCO|nr:glycosyltransferase family 2 protein [Mycolicibacterium obuense]TDL10056.1 glycosyltransferase family 2 protein [Mycolicibacterium obuense]